jgi:hypothetical protein
MNVLAISTAKTLMVVKRLGFAAFMRRILAQKKEETTSAFPQVCGCNYQNLLDGHKSH